MQEQQAEINGLRGEVATLKAADPEHHMGGKLVIASPLVS
jgi:hypothetical protein